MTAVLPSTQSGSTARFVDICAFDHLVPELGVAALVDDRQIAIFRLSDDTVFAVSNICPFSGAAVISRGITGSRGDVPTIASPLYKQVFSLVDGICLDPAGMPARGGDADLTSYPTVVENGRILVDVAGARRAEAA